MSKVPLLSPNIMDMSNTSPRKASSALDDIFEIESLVTIDTDELNKNAEDQSSQMLRYITEVYKDEKFLQSHPQVRNRLDIELESLRSLVKMRNADEQVQDAILKSISQDNTNASMYRSLAEIQKTALNINTKIQDVVNNITGLLRGYQLEMEFGDDGENSDNNISSSTRSRGSRDFIKKMTDVESSPTG